jgi:hypothetical protein
MVSFSSIANSGATAKAADLANAISLALIPTFAAVPLGVLGVILLVVGLATRRPNASS